jgi:hypothetical protein
MGFLVGITFPEVYLYGAFYENLDARSGMEEVPRDLIERWTIVHVYYANSGGFAVEYKIGEEGPRQVKHVVYLTAPIVRWLLAEKRIDLTTFPTREGIEDKSKSDVLAKFITIVQIIWFLAQCVARAAQHLPVTTLEISTLAYIPCAIFAYILWWNKPYEVAVPTILRILPEQSNATALDRNRYHGDPAKGLCKHWRQVETRRILKERVASGFLFPAQEYRSYEISRQCGEIVRSSLVPVGVHGFSSALVFFVVGGIHLAAWNFAFSSLSERWTWRVCSLVIATIIPISWVVTSVLLKMFTHSWWDGSECKKKLDEYRIMRWVTMGIQGIAILIYALARLYLIVEVFAGLRDAPAAVYKTPEWSNFLPHIG